MCKFVLTVHLSCKPSFLSKYNGDEPLSTRNWRPLPTFIAKGRGFYVEEIGIYCWKPVLANGVIVLCVSVVKIIKMYYFRSVSPMKNLMSWKLRYFNFSFLRINWILIFSYFGEILSRIKRRCDIRYFFLSTVDISRTFFSLNCLNRFGIFQLSAFDIGSTIRLPVHFCRAKKGGKYVKSSSRIHRVKS